MGLPRMAAPHTKLASLIHISVSYKWERQVVKNTVLIVYGEC